MLTSTAEGFKQMLGAIAYLVARTAAAASEVIAILNLELDLAPIWSESPCRKSDASTI